MYVKVNKINKIIFCRQIWTPVINSFEIAKNIEKILAKQLKVLSIWLKSKHVYV